MATMTVDCGSFNKTSYGGTTQYGSLISFYVPQDATITGCSVSFTTHGYGGQTVDRAFSLNGSRAHSGWPSTGMSLNAGLLQAGSNTFRVSLKGDSSSYASWNISGITLYITYIEGGTSPGGSATPPNSVWLAKNNVGPGEKVSLEWSNVSWGFAVWYGDNDSSCPHMYWSAVHGINKMDVESQGANNTTRYFRVSSKGTTIDDIGPKSSEVAALKTVWTNPSAPGTPTVSKNNVLPGTNVTLTWSAASAGTNNAVTGYIIEYSTNNATWNAYTSTNASTRSTTVVANSTANASHYFRVKATGENSDGAFSGSVRLISTVGTLSAPTNLRVDGETSILVSPKIVQTLTWSAVDNAQNNTVTGYTVQRLITGGSWTDLVTVNASTTTYDVTASGTNDVAHCYRVRANGSYSNSNFSSNACHTCSYTLPTVGNPQVSSSKVVPGSGNVTFSWTASAGTRLPIASFTIYRDNVAWESGVSASQRSYSVPSHSTQGSAYSYSVVAIGNVSGYDSSRSDNATVTTYGNPSAPSAITINNIAGTVYIGTTASAPSLTLQWSGALAGSHATISQFQVFKNGVHLKDVNVTTTSGSTNIPNTEGASYSVKTVASSGLISETSIARSVSLIDLPNDIQFSAEPSGRTNGTVRYTWGAVTVSNATVKYGLAYKKGSEALKWIGQIDGTTYDFNIAINNTIAPGEDYQLAVIAQAYATHGGITQRDYVLSGTGAYRSANPIAPVITYIKDKDGNTSYVSNQTSGAFTYTVPNRGSPNVEYTVSYRYGTTGGFTSLGKFPDKTFTHNTTSITGGTQIYYRVEVTDEYGNSNSVISSTALTRINNPIIDTPTYAPGGGVPNTQGTITFTPKDGSTSRPLAYQIRLLYDGEAFMFRNYTNVPNVNNLLTDTRNDININTLKNGGLSKLFTEVITNKTVSLPVTVEISLRDNQTIPVLDNTAIYTFNRTLDFRTKPVLTGAIGVRNKTADDNVQSGTISSTIDYLNSSDEVEWNFSDLEYTWVNAAGTTEGADLKVEITDSTGTSILTDWPTDKKKAYIVGVFQNDNNISSSVRVIQNYANNITGISDTVSKTINTKRFIPPSFLMTGYERTASNIFKTSLQFTDGLSGGSNTVSNVLSITDVNMTDGTTPNPLDVFLSINNNRLMINGLQAPRVLGGLNVTDSFDTVVSVTGTMMISSGRTYTIGSASILLKAMGVAMAIRKSRVGINVEPLEFLDEANKPSLVLTEKNTNTTGHQFEIVSSILNNDGAGIKWIDAKTNTNGTINFKNGKFNIANGEILTSLNYSNHIQLPYLPLTGGAITGDLTINGYNTLHSGNYASYVTPAGIGAATSSHNHNGVYLKQQSSGSDPNYNNLTDAGVYRIDDGTITNGPNATEYGNLLVLRKDSSDTLSQILFNYDNDMVSFRSGTITTFTSNTWKQFLHSANYTSYTVTKTGTGASGTWGISITGNAATASTATKLTTARTLTIGNTGKTFDGTDDVSWTLAEIGAAESSHSHTLLNSWPDTRSIATVPNDYNGAFVIPGMKSSSTVGTPMTGSYVSILGFRGWINSSGGIATELAFGDEGIAFRQGETTSWGSWNRLIDSKNFLNYIYPVGAIYMSYVSTSPATLFGGTWSALPTGKVLRTGTGGSTGGSDTHAHSTTAVALTVAQMPSHSHSVSIYGSGSGGRQPLWAYNDGTSYSVSTHTAGSGATHGHGNTGSSSNVPAYYGVYAWRRTA